MMYQGVDLSRFKKIASDGKISTLRHNKGHEIKIAHGALSPEMRHHIDQMPVHMAEGGDPKAIDPESPAPVQDEAPAAAPGVPVTEPAPPTELAPATVPNNTVQVTGQRMQPIYPVDPNYLKKQDVGWGGDLTGGHIEPKTMGDLFEKKDTLGKIGTIFGLLIGGAGAGLSHQPNALLGMMQKQIDNDFEAQKKSKDNAQNFLKLNQEQQLHVAQIDKMKKEGILNDAQAELAKKDAGLKGYTLARMQANRAAFHSLVLQANKLPPGSPQRQAAEQQLAIMSQAVNTENFDMADRAAAASALSHAAFGQVNSQSPNAESEFQGQNAVLKMSGNAPMADDRTARHMPGLEGQASVPLTSADREAITSGVSFQNEMARFIDWSKKHSGDLSPGDRKYGEAMAAQLQGAYRLATKGGVYKEGEQGFISNIIDSTPTKFFNSIRVLPQLKAVQRESAHQLNDIVKSKGFKGYSGPEEVKMSGGKKYKRGPDGKAHLVE